MERWSQKDSRWGDTLIGQSKSKVSTNGCLITSLSMILSKFGVTYTPDRAATHWKFTAVPGDPDPRYIVWNQPFNGMKFVWRNWGYNPYELMVDPVDQTTDTQIGIMKKYMSHKDYGIVLQVQTWKGGQHWLAGEGKAVLGFAANDPIDGKRMWCAPLPYRRLTGWAIMKRT